MNQKCFRYVLLFMMCSLFITSCSTKPTFYSRKDITHYVENVYGKEFKLVKEENHSFTFQNKDGFSFTATAYSQNATFDASETIFYQKNFYTDYTEQVAQFHKDEIQELLKKYDFKLDDIDNSYYQIYVKDTSQLQQLANFLSELDHILSYRFNNNNIPKNMSRYRAKALTICIYMGDSKLLSFDLSSDEDERLDPDQLFTRLEWTYVDCIKDGTINDKINMELWNKYPAYKIKPVYFNGEPLSIEFNDLDTYTLYYNYDLETYVMSYLDPCQDFIDFPYDYSGEGTFSHLVELLGGTYSCEDWKATWKINGNVWRAALHTKKKDNTKYLYDNIKISRNGVQLNLSDDNNIAGNGTVSGRKYTIEDLELMLDIDIEIDQTNMVAYIRMKN